MSALLKQRLLGQVGGCHVTSSHAGGHAPPRGADNTPFTSTKGLLNGPGQNNCFLNSAVQVLWHLDVFRRSFRELSGHACMAEACIFCALKELFGQLQFSQESALPPDALRRALAESFFDQQRFQLGFMDDAAECFENILLRIHYHIANSEAEDMCAARHCIPHQKFAMTLVEQSVCEACHVTSEPLSYTQMVHYVSASALTAQARHTAKTSQPDLFGQLLRKAGGMGDIRDCPSSCGAKIQICRALMNRPEVVSVGVVWDSERPTLEHIMAVFATVGTTLRLSDVFHSVVDHRWAAATSHSLVGVVTYYGKHYSTFFFHTKLRLWIYFDDANVREIGPRFDQVVEKCRRGRYQPLLLLYAVQGGTPVSTESAPKTIVPVPISSARRGDRKPAALPVSSTTSSQIPLRRSVTPSPEKAVGVAPPRRAVTPNPDPDRYADYQNLAHIQAAIFPGEQNGSEYISRQAVESVLSAQNALSRNNSLYEAKRGPLSPGDGIAVPDHLNVPRRRDSGNWSGDRNSASSSSSLENPYLCLVGRMRPVPRSPKPLPPGGLDVGMGNLDPGYDSYSLSSNDSLPLQQGLKHNLQLAQIPEHSGGGSVAGDDCERLCVEADRLLGKARQLESARDLETALVVSRAAADKARRAMDAPYNNPRALSLARMKHNACVMHARSLARRMDESTLDIRHSRENSNGSNRSASHSRQSSRDKPQHSRQSSRELVQPVTVATAIVEEPRKSIEIYATLPRKKLGAPRVKPVEEDAEYMYDRPGRSLHSRVGLRRDDKKDKRAKSEERKSPRDYSLLNTSSTLPKESPKKDKEREKERAKEEKKAKEEAKKEGKAGKKQHKIRRKLLMGGLIRRKNRSMPDLREGQDAVEKPESPAAPSAVSRDDATLPDDDKGEKSMCGYLSEGHLEYGRSNPNLERSRLMRKTSHGARGRLPPKVPPLPPLRTSSQLTPADAFEPVTYANGGILGLLDARFMPLSESTQSLLALPPYPTPMGSANHSRQPSEEFPPPPPPLEAPPDEASAPSTLLAQLQSKRQQILERDASPRPCDAAPTSSSSSSSSASSGETWLRELQAKQAERRRRQSPGTAPPGPAPPSAEVDGLASVRDLASRFERDADAANAPSKPPSEHGFHADPAAPHPRSGAETEKYFQPQRSHAETNGYHNDVADGASHPRTGPPDNANYPQHSAPAENYFAKAADIGGYPRSDESAHANRLPDGAGYARSPPENGNYSQSPAAPGESYFAKPDKSQRADAKSPVDGSYPRNAPDSPRAQDLGVEYLSMSRDAPERVSHHPSPMTNHVSQLRGGAGGGKKKNVTFCDEVILVATADDGDADGFIPNPILERVLRSAFRPNATSRPNDAIDGKWSPREGMAASPPVGYYQSNQTPHTAPMQGQQASLQTQSVPPPVHQQVAAQVHQASQQMQQASLQTQQAPSQTQQAPSLVQQTSLQAPPVAAQVQQASQMQPTPSQPQQVPASSQYRDFQPPPGGYPVQHGAYQQLPGNSAKYQQYVASGAVEPQQAAAAVASSGQPQYQHVVPGSSPQYAGNQIPRYQHLPGQQRLAAARTHQQSPTYGQQYQPTYQHLPATSGIPQYQPAPPPASQIPTAQYGGQTQYYQPPSTSKLQQPVYQRVPSSVLANGSHPPYQYPPAPRQGVRAAYQLAGEGGPGRGVYQTVPENAAARLGQQGVVDGQARSVYQTVPDGGMARPVYQQNSQETAQIRPVYQQTTQDPSQSRPVYQQNPQETAQSRPVYQQNNQDTAQVRPVYQQTSQESAQTRPLYQQNSPETAQPRPVYQQNPQETAQSRPVYQQNSPETAQPRPVYQQNPQETAQSRPVYQQNSPENSQIRTVYQQSNPETAQTRPVYQQNPQETAQTRQVYQQSPQETAQIRPVYQQNPQETGQIRPVYQQNPQETAQTRPVYQQSADGVQSRLSYQHNQDNAQNRLLYQQAQDNSQSRLMYQAANHESAQTRPVYQPAAEPVLPVAKAGPCHLCRKKPVASPAIYCTDCHFYMSRFKPRA